MVQKSNFRKKMKAIPPPYQLVDNEYGLIDDDMVFIDRCPLVGQELSN